MSTSERPETKNLNIVDLLYKLRGDYLVVGITGKIGAGCSTASKVLEKSRRELSLNLQTCCISRAQHAKSENNQNRAEENPVSAYWKYREAQIVNNYLSSIWEPFHVIKMSDMILFFFLLIDKFTFVGLIDKKIDGQTDQIWNEFSTLREKAKEYYEYFTTPGQTEPNGNLISFFDDIHKFKQEILLDKCNLSSWELSELMRGWANSIRQCGWISTPSNNIDKAIGKEEQLDIHPNHKPWKDTPAVLAWTANQFIKMIHRQAKKENKPTRVAIDGIKNPYEVLFFRERYSSFFLLAVHMDEAPRLSRLKELGYSDESLASLDGPDKVEGREFNSKGIELERGFVQVSANMCIEMADIHVENIVDNQNHLVEQVGRYAALMLHPGLLQPTAHERIMQIAFTAKMNSGCLSRQVGAVVTDKHYSVKAIGWNSVPDGQMPCTMRCMQNLENDEFAEDYSTFEKNGDFKEVVNMLLRQYKCSQAMISGLPLYFCFKDIYTSSNRKQEGNQVHTRSLHAEENAFLQLAKYGSMGIEGGCLFTTDQCCVLCAKKAYQLGIRNIYYVSSYKDISESHILGCGCTGVQKAPVMKRFYGVVGSAYSKLFTTFISHKDEITYISKIDVKNSLKVTKCETSLLDNGEDKDSITT